jgi:hypothetical protein
MKLNFASTKLDHTLRSASAARTTLTSLLGWTIAFIPDGPLWRNNVNFYYMLCSVDIAYANLVPEQRRLSAVFTNAVEVLTRHAR